MGYYTSPFHSFFLVFLSSHLDIFPGLEGPKWLMPTWLVWLSLPCSWGLSMLCGHIARDQPPGERESCFSAFLLSWCPIPCGKRICGISLHFVLAIKVLTLFPSRAACFFLCKGFLEPTFPSGFGLHGFDWTQPSPLQAFPRVAQGREAKQFLL